MRGQAGSRTGLLGINTQKRLDALLQSNPALQDKIIQAAFDRAISKSLNSKKIDKFKNKTNKKILAAIDGPLKITVLVTEDEFSTHAKYDRFKSTTPEELLKVVCCVVALTKEAYEQDGEAKWTYFAYGKTKKMYLVIIKHLSADGVGFFSSVMRSDTVKSWHKKLKRVV